MNSRRFTHTPYRLSRARELRPVTSRQMIADFEVSRDTLADIQRTREGSALAIAWLRGPCGRSLCGPWSIIEPRSFVEAEPKPA